jgi:uncharacterized protein
MNNIAGTEGSVHVLRNHILTGKHGRQFLADIAFSVNGIHSPVIIFSHGFKGFKDWGPFNLMAEEFARAGFHFIKYNFAFNGTTLKSPYDFDDLEAFGRNNFTHEMDDIDRVINWAAGEVKNISPKGIFLLGHSRGGGISLLKTGEDKRVNRSVTWGSVTRFTRHISISEIKEWKKSGVMYVENARTHQNMPLFIQLYDDFYKNKKRFDIMDAVTHIDTPILLIHGSDDDTVPVSHAKELAAHGKSIDLIEIPHAGHTFDAVHPMEEQGIPVAMKDVIEKTISFYKSSG